MRSIAIISIAASCVVLAGCASKNAGTTRNLAANGGAVYKTSATPRVSTPSVNTRGSTAYRAPSVQTLARNTANPRTTQRRTTSPQRSVRTTYGTMAAVPPPPPPPPMYGSASTPTATSWAPTRQAVQPRTVQPRAVRTQTVQARPTAASALPPIAKPAPRAAPSRSLTTVRKTSAPRAKSWTYDPFGGTTTSGKSACKT